MVKMNAGRLACSAVRVAPGVPRTTVHPRVMTQQHWRHEREGPQPQQRSQAPLEPSSYTNSGL